MIIEAKASFLGIAKALTRRLRSVLRNLNIREKRSVPYNWSNLRVYKDRVTIDSIEYANANVTESEFRFIVSRESCSNKNRLRR